MITLSTTDMSIWTAFTLMALILAIPALWIIAIAHSAYISSKYLDEMINSIKSSPELSSTIKLYAAMGLSRKIFIPGLLHSAISKRRFASIGFISHADIQNFPTHLKKVISRDNRLYKASLTWTLIVVLILIAKDLPEPSISNIQEYSELHDYFFRD